MLVEDAINHPFCDRHAEANWLIEAEYGPHYSAARWFGATSDKVRMKYCRALKELVELGLVQRCVDSHSGKVLNISLTPAGIVAADRIGAVAATG